MELLSSLNLLSVAQKEAQKKVKGQRKKSVQMGHLAQVKLMKMNTQMKMRISKLRHLQLRMKHYLPTICLPNNRQECQNILSFKDFDQEVSKIRLMIMILLRCIHTQ